MGVKLFPRTDRQLVLQRDEVPAERLSQVESRGKQRGDLPATITIAYGTHSRRFCSLTFEPVEGDDLDRLFSLIAPEPFRHCLDLLLDYPTTPLHLPPNPFPTTLTC